MIQPQTILTVADNSGAKKIMCIRILGNRPGVVGDRIIGVVKQATPNMPMKKSEIVQAVIVRTRKEIGRSNGTYICFNDNAAVIVNSESNPRGTRVFGPVARELRDRRDRQYAKILSLASEVL